MPEDVVFEDLRGNEIGMIGDAFELPQFQRLVRGVSSPIVQVVVRSLSTTHQFAGAWSVEPASGRSYSEDLSVLVPGERWGKFIPLELLPGETQLFSVRVVISSTPDNQDGRGAIKVKGAWQPVG